MAAVQNLRLLDIKQVPSVKSDRTAVRVAAVRFAAGMDSGRLPSRSDLESAGQRLLHDLGMADEFLGFAMVAISNEYWRKQFESTPFERRLLLLPRCMSNSSTCAAPLDDTDLHCINCGACDVGGLKAEAESLGYEVIIAEGTSAVVMKILQGQADALLGVACLDSLDRSYTQVVELGIPHMAIPLLHDGCVDTDAEVDELVAVMHSVSDTAVSGPRTYLPLLRETVHIFDTPSLQELLPPEIGRFISSEDDTDPATATEIIALDWFKNRGKRLRPFLTTSAYAVARYGAEALSSNADAAAFIPASVKRIAVAIEALHKASLIHDDIEDDDEYRYGRRTIHRQYGIAPAINVGDYLVGMGYSLIARESASMGEGCIGDILTHLSSAHLDLCRGQGAELMWKGKDDLRIRPIEVLSIYALKTAPALEVALYAGLRTADVDIDDERLRQFCVYLGEGYQILNDLDDWVPDSGNRISAGGDALADRPTILHAFALEAARDETLVSLLQPSQASRKPAEEVDRLRSIYAELGAFDQARRMVDRLRDRAMRLSGEFRSEPLRELMSFLTGLILRGRAHTGNDEV
jgi:geranylgeranyl pyrophosphate synthase